MSAPTDYYSRERKRTHFPKDWSCPWSHGLEALEDAIILADQSKRKCVYGAHRYKLSLSHPLGPLLIKEKQHEGPKDKMWKSGKFVWALIFSFFKCASSVSFCLSGRTLERENEEKMSDDPDFFLLCTGSSLDSFSLSLLLSLNLLLKMEMETKEKEKHQLQVFFLFLWFPFPSIINIKRQEERIIFINEKKEQINFEKAFS